MKIPDNVDFEEYLKFIGEQESQEMHSANHWIDELLTELEGGGAVTGDFLPWSKSHGVARLRPAELSIWAGVNGHRKSMMLGMVMAWIAQHSRVFIASLEMKPHKTMERMSHQIAGCKPSPQCARDIWDHLDSNVIIYDQLDSLPPEQILGAIYYAAVEMQCKHIVIDSLAKCGVGSEKYDDQKNFIDRLAWCAKRTGAHIHLVHHIRKGVSERNKPDKMDVKGAGEITDLADNVFLVWMDKKRADLVYAQRMGKPLNEDELAYIETHCDQTLTVAKQRHGEWEGELKLWFHPKSLQFIPEDRTQAMPYEIPVKVAAA